MVNYLTFGMISDRNMMCVLTVLITLPDRTRAQPRQATLGERVYLKREEEEKKSYSRGARPNTFLSSIQANVKSRGWVTSMCHIFFLLESLKVLPWALSLSLDLIVPRRTCFALSYLCYSGPVRAAGPLVDL